MTKGNIRLKLTTTNLPEPIEKADFVRFYLIVGNSSQPLSNNFINVSSGLVSDGNGFFFYIPRKYEFLGFRVNAEIPCLLYLENFHVTDSVIFYNTIIAETTDQR